MTDYNKLCDDFRESLLSTPQSAETLDRWCYIYAAIEVLRVDNARLERRCERCLDKVAGEWITTRTLQHDGEPYCSICGEEPYRESNKNMPKYCPNCGAKMDGGSND